MQTPEGVIGQPISGIPDFYSSGPNDRYAIGSQAFPYGQDGGPMFEKRTVRHPKTGDLITGWQHVEGGVEPPPLPVGTARSL